MVSAADSGSDSHAFSDVRHLPIGADQGNVFAHPELSSGAIAPGNDGADGVGIGARSRQRQVAKHRHGSTGTVSLYFRKELTPFRDLEIQRTELEY